MKCDASTPPLVEENLRMAGSLQRIRTMQRIYMVLSGALLAAVAGGCQPAPATEGQTVEMRTVDNAELNSLPVEAPPMITEQSTELRATERLGADGKPIRERISKPDPEAEVVAPIILPFAPLIAMDPVDGSKVSIRVETPVTEYKDRLYYFGSAQNKAAFVADPEKYATGSLSKY